ncbi:MAG TPA: MFS transporter [Candidatus Stackebrandtia excrementipullorum]|nr:MFS transporter [Candidatus Stackebrandtia excrementipullorum]
MFVRPAWLTPTRTYLTQVGFASMAYALAATLQIVYQVQVVGLTPIQLVLVGTVLEATVFFSEIPTGIVADQYSRRLSIIIGAVLSGLGFMIQGFIPTFAAALVCSVVWGIGFAFISGAGQAWLVDEIGRENALPALTRARQLDMVVTIVGILIAGTLGVFYLGLPLIIAGAVFLLLAVFLTLFMTENGWSPTPREERETFADMGRQLVTGVRAIRNNRVVLTLVAVALFVGLSSEAFDRLWTDRILTDFNLPPIFGVDPDVAWFTGIALVGTLFSLIISLTVNRVSKRAMNDRHPNRLLGGLMGVQVLGILCMGVSPWLGLALGGMWLRDAARDLAYPVQTAWMNRHLETNARATVMSMSSQVDAFGQVAGGPSLGAVGSRWGLTAAIAGSAAVLTPAILLFLRLRPPTRKENKAVEDEAAAEGETPAVEGESPAAEPGRTDA